MLKLKLSQHLPMPIEVNLECAPGELHALVGPSGSGKTTVLRTIAGLRHASSGKIECNSEVWFERGDLSSATTLLRAAQRSCGFLFQQYALFPHLNALENVAIPLQNSELSSSERKAVASDWLKRMGIAELAQRMPNELSGGQRQRVGIARALMQSPKLLLVDEPTASLDPKTSRQIMRLILELCQERGLAAIVNIHDVVLATEFLPRIVGLRAGVVVYDGPAANIDETVLTSIYGDEDWTSITQSMQGIARSDAEYDEQNNRLSTPAARL